MAAFVSGLLSRDEASRVMVFPRNVGECVVVSDVTAREVMRRIEAVL